MDSFVRSNWNDPEIQSIFQKLQLQTPAEAIDLFKSWIEADKKEGSLKQIQGKIWKQAFETGQIRAHVYADVPQKWDEWKNRGIRIYIFSSGSVEAQQLLFRYAEAGDLTRYIDGYFDTTTGPKKESESYIKIAAALKLAPTEILFLSDVAAELDAAQAAGMETIQIVREVPVATVTHRSATSFEQITV